MLHKVSCTLAPALAYLLLLAGCGSLPVRSEPETAIAAERAFARGDFAEAAQGFLDAAAERRSQRDRLYLRAAEAWREEGELERSASLLKEISSRRLDPDALQRLGLLQAEIALSRNQPREALAYLDEAATQATPRYRARLLELRARAFEAEHQPWRAASALAELGTLLERSERSANRRRIQTLLEPLDDASLAAGAAALPAGDLLYPHTARTLLSRGLPLPRPLPGGADTVATGFGTMPADADGYRPVAKVALLLPLNGVLAEAAQAVRDGFIAAYFEESRKRPEVRVYATDSSPETALEAWQAAVRDGAQIIVGPLGREAVTAIFDADREGQVPLLALNRSDSTPPPPGSMSFALAPEDEGITIANRIVRRGGLRVLVFETEDDYGQRASAAVAQRLQQRGARVVGSARLPANTPNYAAAITAALAQVGARSVVANGDTRIEQNRIAVDADAIFYAGRAAQARLLVPQLRMAGIYDLPIYATSQIAAGSGNTRLDRELDGIEFTESPWLFRDRLAGVPSHSAIAALDSARGNTARLFSFGLDAFLLVGHFDQLRRDPQATLSGATGRLRFDGFGQVLRTPGWARFQGGRIQPARELGLIGDDIQYRQP